MCGLLLLSKYIRPVTRMPNSLVLSSEQLCAFSLLWRRLSSSKISFLGWDGDPRQISAALRFGQTSSIWQSTWQKYYGFCKVPKDIYPLSPWYCGIWPGQVHSHQTSHSKFPLGHSLTESKHLSFRGDMFWLVFTFTAGIWFGLLWQITILGTSLQFLREEKFIMCGCHGRFLKICVFFLLFFP